MAGASPVFGLYEALQRITGKAVDLVTPEGLTNPYFKASIERNKRLIYAALESEVFVRRDADNRHHRKGLFHDNV